MKIEMNPNETVIKAGNSDCVSTGNTIKGKLILTNQRIYFKPEPNGQTHPDLQILPGEIKDVMFYNNRFLFSNGLNIITKDGAENKFLVNNRSDWSEMIVRMC